MVPASTGKWTRRRQGVDDYRVFAKIAAELGRLMPDVNGIEWKANGFKNFPGEVILFASARRHITFQNVVSKEGGILW